MCLVAIALEAHPRYPLIIAANRDEFHARPSQTAAPWPDPSGVYGGRDLKSGGAWLAADSSGRYALVTNIRRLPLREGRSRGALVADFMRSRADARGHAQALVPEARSYRPFNLVLGDARDVVFMHSERGAAESLAAGIHVISNADLDTDWPKTRRLRAVVDAFCAAGERDFDVLWCALADPRQAADSELPDTGVGVERERLLSAAFIVGEIYGTRASTLYTIDRAGNARLHERAFGPGGIELTQTRLAWALAAPPLRQLLAMNALAGI